MGVDVKICGLSTAETLEAALAAGADLVGFVHFPKSPRHVSLADAPALVAQVRGRAQTVLLLVNPDDATLDAAVSAFQPDIIQLHGSESPARVSEIRVRTGRPVMKALPVARAEDLALVPDYARVADRLLFDAKPLPDDTLPGGNGRPFDWNLLAGLDPGRPVMLSGGLDAGSLPHALAVARVDGVDVSSGVETAPGRKSAEKIFAFVQAARAAAAQASGEPTSAVNAAPAGKVQ